MFDRILVNVVPVIEEIVIVANPVVGESALPDFSLAPEDGSECMRIAAFYQLNSVFERDVVRGSE